MILKRKLYSGSDYCRALSIEELRAMARQRLPYFVVEYLDGGAEDERTLQHNRTVFDALRFRPDTLVDTGQRDISISLFGQSRPTPFIIAPTGLNGLYHQRGDMALARAASAAGVPFTVSTVSNLRLEEIRVEVDGPLWMQLYVMQDRAIARDIIDRAERAGYEALVFTTDANVFGRREWDRRNYRAPGKLTLKNLFDVMRHPRWLADVMIPHGIPPFGNIAEYIPPEARSGRGGVAVVPKLFAADISWQDVEWIRERWPRKLLLKGVLNPVDAERAAQLGCDGVILSNHGGRQLETCVSPMEVLPEISQAVGDRLTIIVDSGFRRGTDVVKALAFGAHAVMLGRAPLYGLAAGGEAGVGHALSLLNGEVDRVLGQLGCCCIGDLTPLHCRRDSR